MASHLRAGRRRSRPRGARPAGVALRAEGRGATRDQFVGAISVESRSSIAAARGGIFAFPVEQFFDKSDDQILRRGAMVDCVDLQTCAEVTAQALLARSSSALIRGWTNKAHTQKPSIKMALPPTAAGRPKYVASQPCARAPTAGRP